MMELIAYTYDADYHCTGCAYDRFPGMNSGNSDEYRDSEGNPPHPLFDTDEWYANDMYEGNTKATLGCSTCHEVILEVDLV